MNMTTTGAPRIATLNPYERQEAELIAWSSGVSTEVCSEGGLDVCNINNGDYIKVEGVDFGSCAKTFFARVASAATGGNIELHLDSLNGVLAGTCAVGNTGGWQTWATVNCSVSNTIGIRDVFFVYTGSSTVFLFNINWWEFS
jgi:arabinoxylan arabinofuranohydrolase